jgi:hypothetical protein
VVFRNPQRTGDTQPQSILMQDLDHILSRNLKIKSSITCCNSLVFCRAMSKVGNHCPKKSSMSVNILDACPAKKGWIGSRPFSFDLPQKRKRVTDFVWALD